MVKVVLTEEALKSHIAIVGRTGSGKSYAAKGVIEAILKTGKSPVCVVDPGGDFWGLRSSADGKRAGFPVAVLGGDHADIEIATDSGAKVARFVANERVSCVIDVSEWYKSDQLKFMIGFAEEIYKANRSPLHLILDEADQFIPQNPLAEGKKLLNRMDRLVRLGRKRGFRIAMITQRPAILHKNALTQANSLIVLQMTAPQDRNAIEEWIKGNADSSAATKVLKTLARMPRGEGWVWEPQQDRLERVQFPRIKTFDAGSTPEDGERLVPKKLADVDLTKLQAAFAPPSSESEPSNEGMKTVSAQSRQQGKNQEVIERLSRELSAAKESNITLARSCGRLDMIHVETRAALETMVQAGLKALKSIDSIPAQPVVPIDTGALTEITELTKVPSVVTRSRPASNDGDPDISAGALTLLTGYAGMYPRSCTAKQAATRAGQSVKSSAFRPNQKQLLDSSLIEANNSGGYRIVEAGLALTGTDVLDSGASLAHWKNRLPPTQANLLTAIQNHAPLTKLEAAEHANISPTSSGLGSGLKSLVDLALIERDQDNRYHLCEGLTG